jgi:hypothetical protein
MASNRPAAKACYRVLPYTRAARRAAAARLQPLTAKFVLASPLRCPTGSVRDALRERIASVTPASMGIPKHTFKLSMLREHSRLPKFAPRVASRVVLAGVASAMRSHDRKRPYSNVVRR